MIFGARDYDKCGFRRKWARNRKVGELIRLQEGDQIGNNGPIVQMKSGWQWKQKDDEFERDFKAELAELEIDCKSMGVNSEPRRHCPS